MNEEPNPNPTPPKKLNPQRQLPHNLRYLLDEGFYVGECVCNGCKYRWIAVLDKKDMKSQNKIRCNNCGIYNNQWNRIRKKDLL